MKKPEVMEVRIQGAVSEEAVRSVLDKALERWAKDKSLSRLRGTLVLAMEILPNGKVGRTWLQEKGNAEDEVLEVLLKKARDLVFPEQKAKSYVQKRIFQRVHAAKVNDHIFEIVQMAYEEALAAENIALSRPERKRLFSQVLKLVLEDMIEKLSKD